MKRYAFLFLTISLLTTASQSVFGMYGSNQEQLEESRKQDLIKASIHVNDADNKCYFNVHGFENYLNEHERYITNAMLPAIYLRIRRQLCNEQETALLAREMAREYIKRGDFEHAQKFKLRTWHNYDVTFNYQPMLTQHVKHIAQHRWNECDCNTITQCPL